MTVLVVDLGGLSYRSPDLAVGEVLPTVVAVDEALTALGFEAWVHPTGFTRDEYGALRPSPPRDPITGVASPAGVPS